MSCGLRVATMRIASRLRRVRLAFVIDSGGRAWSRRAWRRSKNPPTMVSSVGRMRTTKASK
jgi:hypothetical protein